MVIVNLDATIFIEVKEDLKSGMLVIKTKGELGVIFASSK